MHFTVSRKVEFCYGHRLLNYEGKCKYLHGHNGIAIIKIRASQLDKLGMVVDFSEIKSKIANWINENLDHRLILSKDDPLVPILKEASETFYTMDVNPTAENIAKLIYDNAKMQNFDVEEVVVWETENCQASYKSA